MSSVFNRNKNLLSMQDSKIPCSSEHTFNGVVPTVNEDLHEIQNKELIGKPCDCGKFIYNELLCGCSIQKWKIELLANPNY